MNKKDLINKVAEKSEMNKKDTGVVIDAVLEAITESLTEQQDVKLLGFGTFKVKERAARKARNPQTGKEITVPARNAVSFKPSQSLKDAVKG